MSILGTCDGCGEVHRCDYLNGDLLCDQCQTDKGELFAMADAAMAESDLEAAYLESIDNPFGYEVMDQDQYIKPENEFDDFDLGSCEDYYDDSMDGDHESAFGSIGWAENEYYDHGSFDDYDF